MPGRGTDTLPACCTAWPKSRKIKKRRGGNLNIVMISLDLVKFYKAISVKLLTCSKYWK